LLRGRHFSVADRAIDAAPVAIIDASLAQALFGEADPLGQRVNFRDRIWEVVGLAGDISHGAKEQRTSQRVYAAQELFPHRYATLVVRTHNRIAQDILATARRVIAGIDPQLPVTNIRTLESAVDSALQRQRVIMWSLLVFSLVALFLACLGLYGLLAHAVAQRFREISIRLALGATPAAIVGMVFAQGAKLTMAGIVIGIAGGLGLPALMQSLLFEIGAADPIAIAGASGALFAVSAIACAWPAWRASSLDPAMALRAE
jgi:putative ABC transport system permease protein